VERILTIGGAALALAAAAVAATCAHGAARAEGSAPTCRAMGMRDPSPQKPAGRSTFRGTTCYFCCSGCEPLSGGTPEEYAGGGRK